MGLKDIRSRIASVKNTQKITGAMKMVSAAKLKRAQDNITNMRPYAKGLLKVMADVVASERVTHPLLTERTDNAKKVLMVVVSSDRGLCGGFNATITKTAMAYYLENKPKLETLDLFFIGKKTAASFKSKEILGKETLLNVAKDISYNLASDISNKLLKSFNSGEYDEIRLVYNEFKSAIAQVLRVETLLPIDIEAIEALNASVEEKDSQFSNDMIFEPSPEKIMEDFIKKYFTVQVYRILSESVAAEHAARMTAMDNATTNAKDMIKNLTLTYNKLRQAAITTELIEICSGAEALKN